MGVCSIVFYFCSYIAILIESKLFGGQTSYTLGYDVGRVVVRTILAILVLVILIVASLIPLFNLT